MTPAVRIRPASQADLAAVSRLLGETWHATYDAIYGRERVDGITASWHAPASLAQGLDRKDVTFLVAEAADGTITGTASVSLSACGAAMLDRLYVLPSRQGSGIGARLLVAALAAYPEAAVAVLEVEPENRRAIAFYERHGFARAGRTGDCGGKGEEIAALVMERRTAAEADHAFRKCSTRPPQ